MNELEHIAAVSPGDSPAERVERHQALEPGVYWRAVKETLVPCANRPGVESTVAAGTVLLLLDVEYFDHRPHTVVLHDHPLRDGGDFKMLVGDFLAHFAPAPDGEAVRAREMQSLQAEIQTLQSELMVCQQDPDALRPVLEKAVQEWEASHPAPAAASKGGNGSDDRSRLATIPTAAVQTGVQAIIDQRVSDSELAAYRHLAEREAILAEAKMNWLKSRTDQIAATMARLSPFFAEKVAVALARTRGVRRRAEDILKGLESLDLYTGKGVEVEVIAEGDGAPGREPLTLLQRKLFMAEELAAWAEVGADFDFYSVDRFDEQLRTNTALRDQIFPVPRCVVSMAVRRDDVNYGDPWRNLQRNIENKRVFLLVRNGDNLCRVYSSTPSHEAAGRLFPIRDEFDRLFAGIDGSTIRFEDVRFTDRASKADDLALHYKRFLILLCGLDHRLGLFGEFYDRSEALSFVSLEFQRRHFRFLADDDRSRLLGDGRPHVEAWVREKNTYLQSGSRVLCYYPDLIGPETAPACEKWAHNGRRNSPEILARPVVPGEIKVAYRDGTETCVDVEVKRSNEWRRYSRTVFNARVNLTKAAADSAIPGFLCLDAVTPEEVEAYIYDREARIQHIQYIRLFKIAAAQLRADRSAETPSRSYLQRSIVEAGIAEDAEAERLVDESVRAWRCANRGAPLPLADDKVSLEPILNHLYSLRRQQASHRALIERHILERGHTPLKATLTGKNRIALYVEVPPSERDEAIADWRWVRRIRLGVLKTKLTESSDRLVWLRDTPDASETTLQTWPGLASWINDGPEVISPGKLAEARELVDRAVGEAAQVFVAAGGGIPATVFETFLAELRRRLYEGRGRIVPSVYLSVPVGAFLNRGGLSIVGIHGYAQHWLYHFANPEQRARLEEVFVGVYQDKAYARDALRRPFRPVLAARNGLPESVFDFDGVYAAHGQLYEASSVRRAGGSPFALPRGSYHLNRTLERWMAACRSNSANGHRDAPKRVYLNPLVWDGSKAHLERYFSGLVNPRSS